MGLTDLNAFEYIHDILCFDWELNYDYELLWWIIWHVEVEQCVWLFLGEFLFLNIMNGRFMLILMKFELIGILKYFEWFSIVYLILKLFSIILPPIKRFRLYSNFFTLNEFIVFRASLNRLVIFIFWKNLLTHSLKQTMLGVRDQRRSVTKGNKRTNSCINGKYSPFCQEYYWLRPWVWLFGIP